MANSNFRVRTGLDIGDTVTITDAGVATGLTNLTIDNINIDGNTIVSTNTNGDISLTPNGTGEVNISRVDINAGAIDGTTIGAASAAAGTFTTATATTGNITTVNSTTVDTTNLDVTNIRALDGTAAASIANSTGVITVSTELNVDNINVSGNTIISTNTNGAINLTPNGTGTVVIPTADVTNLDVTNIRALDGTAAATIADTTGVITVSTALNVDNLNLDGNTVSSTDTNGSITLDPNGTGNVVFTFANGGNISNNRNYVAGAIRNATTQGLGDIWAVDADSPSTGSPTQPFRGLSIDNSADTARIAGLVLRNYSDTAVNRSRVVFERARGTPGSSTAPLSNDFLGEVCVTGATGTNTWLNDTIPAVPGFFGFKAAENWVSNTNLGTEFALSLAPTATTIASGANLTQTFALTPQGAALRSDIFSIGRGKTNQFTAGNCSISGTTLTIGSLATGSVVVGSGINTNTNTSLYGVYIIRNISGSGSGSTWELSSAPGTFTGLSIQGTRVIAGSNGTTFDSVADLRLITNTVKGSGGTTQIVTSSAGATLELRGDTIQLENAAGTALTGNLVDYNRVFGQWQNLNTITPLDDNTAYAFALPTIDFANVASVGSTSRIIPGALGYYKTQFSVQVLNGDNGSEHDAYFWWRKNGTDVPGSMGRVTIPKGSAGGQLIVGWDNMIQVTTITDYWELMYAVEDTQVTFPTYAATAFGPATAALFVTIVPIGA